MPIASDSSSRCPISAWCQPPNWLRLKQMSRSKEPRVVCATPSPSRKPRSQRPHRGWSTSSLTTLVVFSAGIAPLAGGSEIGIFASDTGIPKISVGKPSEKRLWFPVKKSESEFLILEFWYIINVGLSMITQRQETTRHKMFPPV